MQVHYEACCYPRPRPASCLLKASKASLIGVMGIKLFLSPCVIPVDQTLLFAVGAWPPHDGVRRGGVSICLATFGALTLRLRTLNEIASPSSPRERRRLHPSHDGNWDSLTGTLSHAADATAGSLDCLPQWNSVPSLHMRCRITASLRATATRARAMPRRLAIFMPQARNADHLVLRISGEGAAS